MTQVDTDAAWRLQAACRGKDVEQWFPDGHIDRDVASAMQTCSRCPVRVDCIDYALTHHETFGIWGGFTPRQRRMGDPVQLMHIARTGFVSDDAGRRLAERMRNMKRRGWTWARIAYESGMSYSQVFRMMNKHPEDTRRREP